MKGVERECKSVKKPFPHEQNEVSNDPLICLLGKNFHRHRMKPIPFERLVIERLAHRLTRGF